MVSRSRFHKLRSLFGRRQPNAVDLRNVRTARLQCNQLETRLTPSTYIVKTTADNGDNLSPILGSLREGINFVNKFGFTTILFSLPPGSVITPVADLHPILVPCTIDGGSPAAVSIFGGGAGMAPGLEIKSGAAGTVIRGLGIHGFSSAGIKIDASSVTVESCNIGTDPMGKTAIPNGGGIVITGSGATIGSTDPAKGNLISGNKGVGIEITGTSTGNKILANRIGTTGDGTMPLGNGSHGIRVTSGTSQTIGGDDAADGVVDGKVKVANVIFFNSSSGISVSGKSTSGVVIQGNLIGSNAAHGISVVDAPGVVIGGTSALAANIIGLNKMAGVHLEESGGGVPGGGALIQGNRIGVMPDGASLLPNTGNGIEIVESDANVIGGTSIVARNIISGNEGTGISINGKTSTGNVVSGNYIGVLADGTSAGGNKFHGVYIGDDASKNTIGGATKSDANIIAFNGETAKLKGHGVVVASGTMNKISHNSIYENAGRGIDLGSKNVADGPSLNDRGGDADSGANGLQDYPVAISRSPVFVGSVFITWALESTPSTTFIVELYSNDKLDKSGWGEGQTHISDVTVTTNSKGYAEFTTFSADKIKMSATATDPDGNTSEFSMIDTDCDALADAWELTGIDINEDETVDLSLGSDPFHKDIFVEVDAMVDLLAQSRALKINTALALVSASFAAAPDSLVGNPDQVNGITLHAAVDEDNLANQPLDGGLVEVRSIRNGTGAGFDGRFGTAIDRGNTGNWVNIRAARDLVYRYCIFGETGKLDGLNAQGASELPGKNFFVALPDNILGGITAEDRAGVFMHELGHALGLRHGGNTDVNYKPNYYSVMNYTWAVPNVLSRMTNGVVPDYSTSKILDYSRSVLPTIDENLLNEATSIGGPVGKFVPTELTPLALVSMGSNPDWNRDGDSLDAGFSRDINMDGDSDAVLTGHEDWSKLFYYVGEDRGGNPPEDEGDEISGTPLLPSDFGDAPDPMYPTLAVSGGAQHLDSPDGPILGTVRDFELNGQPQTVAMGDDTNGGPADEDGVVFAGIARSSQPSSVTVTASKASFLDAWIDFNNDGDWLDSGEQIATKLAMSAGANVVAFKVPTSAVVNPVAFARFRLSSYGGLAPTGLAYDGEVEDHTVNIQLPESAPKVTSVVINDGKSLQRSRVTEVTVNFDSVVSLPVNPADAFNLTRQHDSKLVTLAAVVTDSDKTSVTLTFTGGAVDGKSLDDGRYTLTAFATKISHAGGSLDGDGMGGASEDYVLASAKAPATATNIFRLYGDGDGDGAVTSSDFALFRQTFGTAMNLAFDWNENGTIDSTDFSAFRKRFGISVP